jgi:hypothetical protein
MPFNLKWILVSIFLLFEGTPFFRFSDLENGMSDQSELFIPHRSPKKIRHKGETADPGIPVSFVCSPYPRILRIPNVSPYSVSRVPFLFSISPMGFPMVFVLAFSFSIVSHRFFSDSECISILKRASFN